ncbi:integral membrane protein MviN [Salinisphaera sp. PC39]|uniref:murein biosynthesis integral membrane protein MurJ n=1 Tax=Salinisphaera sp. PC39 TaxID=1304156 RepID=UPI003340D175
MSSSLLKSTGVVGLMTLLSRVLGFLRDVVLAVLFGAGAGMDAFLVAFKIPNFMRRLFAEGAFAQSFVPVLSATKSRDGEAEVRELVNVVAGTLGAILVLITAVGVVAAPLLILLFAPGFAADAAQFELATSLLRLTFPYLLFISLTAFAGGILNTYGRFAVPAFTPVLLNLCLIAAALWLAPRFARPEMALAVGVFAAGVAQLALQLPFLARLGLLPRPRWGWAHAQVRRILRLMLPILFGSSVAQVNLMLDTILASLLAAGSVSWLYFSDRLMEFPLGVFSIAIATVILPSLSASHARESADSFSNTLDWALRLLVVIGTPAMVGLFVLAGPLIATLFHYRSFGVADVLMSRYSLMAYALGFMGFSLVKVLVPGFFAREDSRTPVRYGVISVAATMAMNLGFVGALVWLAAPAPHAGLALATSLGAFVNAGLLYRRLRRDGVYRPTPGWVRLAAQVALASAAMAAMLAYAAGPLADWLAWDAARRAATLGGLVAGGAAVYFGVLFAAGVRPRQVWRASGV